MTQRNMPECGDEDCTIPLHQSFRRRLFEAQVEATRYGEFEMCCADFDYKDQKFIARNKAEQLAGKWDLFGRPYPGEKHTVENELADMIYQTYCLLNQG